MIESKALREVGEWKNTVYNVTKDMDKKGVIKYFRKNVDEFLEKMGYWKVIDESTKVYRLNRNL